MSDYNDMTPEEAELKAEIDKAELIRRRREQDDIRHVMSSREGRRVVWDLLARAGVFRISFAGDNNATNFNEGRRDIGLRLYADIMNACPELYLTMAGEAKEGEDDGNNADSTGTSA